MTRRTLEESVRIYGPPQFRRWGYRLPCIKVGCQTTDYRPGSSKVIEICHTVTDGIAMKAAWERHTYFGCWRCHNEQSNHGLETFALRHRLAVDGIPVSTLKGAAALTYTMFLIYDGGLAE